MHTRLGRCLSQPLTCFLLGNRHRAATALHVRCDHRAVSHSLGWSVVAAVVCLWPVPLPAPSRLFQPALRATPACRLRPARHHPARCLWPHPLPMALDGARRRALSARDAARSATGAAAGRIHLLPQRLSGLPRLPRHCRHGAALPARWCAAAPARHPAARS